MTQPYTQKGGLPYAVVLSFFAGCIELLAGLLNLGFLMDFISGPVISGFCSAAGTTIIMSQLKTILGLKFPGSAFAQVLPGIFLNWQDILLWDTILGFAFIAFLLILKVNFSLSFLRNTFTLLFYRSLNFKNLTEFKKCCARNKPGCCLHRPVVDKTLWFISTCRNALAVVLGCVAAYVLHLYGYTPFRLTGILFISEVVITIH